jgi:Uma2 family endonuclease
MFIFAPHFLAFDMAVPRTQSHSSVPKRLYKPSPVARVRKGAVELVPKRPRYDGLRMKREDFLAWEREADGWKYEWNKGIIEINEVNMTAKERKIVKAITRAFIKTEAFENGDEIFPETDCEFHVLDTMRRPDLAYFTNEQIEASWNGEQPVPPFVIELISKNDKFAAITHKIDEYFSVGVQCVWYIHPEQERVYVYTSPTEVHICTGDILCSAAPALPEFSLSPNQLFA